MKKLFKLFSPLTTPITLILCLLLFLTSSCKKDSEQPAIQKYKVVAVNYYHTNGSIDTSLKFQELIYLLIENQNQIKSYEEPELIEYFDVRSYYEDMILNYTINIITNKSLVIYHSDKGGSIMSTEVKLE